MRLIRKNDILNYRSISNSVKENVINQYIDDAQLLDLCPLLGEKFYFSIISDPKKYCDLLNGVKYDFNGVQITSPGLKRVLVDFSYARYILHGSTTDTPFGLVEKQYRDGVGVGRTSKKEIYKLSQQTAMQYWQQLEKYLDRHAADYPLWNVACTKKKRTFRFNKITR